MLVRTSKILEILVLRMSKSFLPSTSLSKGQKELANNEQFYRIIIKYPLVLMCCKWFHCISSARSRERAYFVLRSRALAG